jgi:hypothetical protein
VVGEKVRSLFGLPTLTTHTGTPFAPTEPAGAGAAGARPEDAAAGAGAATGTPVDVAAPWGSIVTCEAAGTAVAPALGAGASEDCAAGAGADCPATLMDTTAGDGACAKAVARMDRATGRNVEDSMMVRVNVRSRQWTMARPAATWRCEAWREETSFAANCARTGCSKDRKKQKIVGGGWTVDGGDHDDAERLHY